MVSKGPSIWPPSFEYLLKIHVFIDICAKLKRITRVGDIHSLSLTLNEHFPTSDDNKSKVKSVDKGW